MSDPTVAAPEALDAAGVMQLQNELTLLQNKAAEGTANESELRRAIEIIRRLRRTNTGPAARKTRAKGAEPKFDPLAMLNKDLGAPT